MHWTSLLRARAIENQALVVGVNRCGRDPGLTYSGGTIVIDAAGQTLVEAVIWNVW
jgi:predicted amidohydrolase